MIGKSFPKKHEHQFVIIHADVLYTGRLSSGQSLC
jgi:hypothetical protein